MKLLFENWRKYLNEAISPYGAQWKAMAKSIKQEDRYIFYEWLTNEAKDGLFKNWIEIHQERGKYVAPRYGYYDPYYGSEWAPREIKKHSDACKLGLNSVPHGATEYAKKYGNFPTWDRGVENKVYAIEKELAENFTKAEKEIAMHLHKIKLKFPYDVFPEFDCKEKMMLLDILVHEVISCPYPPEYSMADYEMLATENLEGSRTPYEKCAIEFNNRTSAEDEINRITNPDLQEVTNETPV